MKKVGGNFIADGNAVNLDIGFVPDKFVAVAKLEETNAVNYEWTKSRGDSANTNGQFGLTRAAGGGALTKLASAAGGFAEYDTVAFKVLLPSPSGTGEQAADYPNSWTQARASAATARSTTALGTVIKPTTGNETGLIFECTNDATGGSTEPTWPTIPGETVTDGSVVWIARTEKVKKIGAKGITIGADIGTDTDEWTWEAEKWDSDAPERDSATFDPVGKYQND